MTVYIARNDRSSNLEEHPVIRIQVQSDSAVGTSLPASRDIAISARIPLSGPSGPFELAVDLTIPAGSFVAIVGPSGAGKTTLLRFIAGLHRATAGHIRAGSDIWCDASARIEKPTWQRSIGFVFQDYALFPNMTVRGNVDYAIGAARNRERIDELLALVDLSGLADAYPARLSGGQKQRLALIRALARRPSLLMLDEPLSALDPELRRQLQDTLRRLHAEFGTTTLMVSHDVPEILRLADRVVRLEAGRVAFDGSPEASLSLPDNDGALRIIAQHVSGPDAAGFAMVHLDGSVHRVRYSDGVANLTPGDTVVLEIRDVAARQLKETDPLKRSRC